VLSGSATVSIATIGAPLTVPQRACPRGKATWTVALPTQKKTLTQVVDFHYKRRYFPIIFANRAHDETALLEKIEASAAARLALPAKTPGGHYGVAAGVTRFLESRGRNNARARPRQLAAGGGR